ncbi:hypothetical protein [Breoghania sp. JC706]|uniref:hypothetical protein n=1 Tax=Breoghania sp. JC706 TaxID=3117732 RepID=UPI003009E57A
MSDPEANSLNRDQNERVERTLTRIRAGLSRFRDRSGTEPAHFFQPEAFDDSRER